MDTADNSKLDRMAIALRLGVYLFLAIAGMSFLPLILEPSGKLITATMTTFAAAAIANAAVLRIYERGLLADVGLGWNAASRRNLLIGLGGGIASALAVVLVPVVLRVADVVPAATPFNAGSVLFVSIVLLFGAVGEEMLFRGYGFQLLVGYFGAWATILPFGILFAFAHLANPNQNGFVGPLNTALWGIVLGYAFLRSHDLWLPIGIHFGWNWVLPLFGVNLSGFTMGMSGVEMRWRTSELWSGGQYGPEGGLVTTIVLFALSYYLYRAPVGKQTAFLLGSNQDAV